jgi:hypothetical protein
MKIVGHLFFVRIALQSRLLDALGRCFLPTNFFGKAADLRDQWL